MTTLWDAYQQKQSFGDGADYRVFKILGRRSAFTSTSVLNDIKEFAASTAAVPVLAGTENLAVVSSHAKDAAAGDGVRKIRVAYIDTSDNLVESADITLNGVTPVTVAWKAKEILWMEVVSAGTDGVAVGNITLNIVAGADLEQITAGELRSRSARFMVPAGYVGFLLSWHGSAIGTTMDLRLLAQVKTIDRSLTTFWVPQDGLYVPSGDTKLDDLVLLPLPALCKMKISTLAGATEGTLRCDVALTIALVKV